MALFSLQHLGMNCIVYSFPFFFVGWVRERERERERERDVEEANEIMGVAWVFIEKA